MKTFTLLAALLIAPAAFAQDATNTGASDPAHKTHDMSKSSDTSKSTDMKSTDTSKSVDGKAEKLTQTELQVLAHYHALDQMEIDLAKTALRKTKNADVKSYSQMLIKDHTDSDKKLVSFAKKHGQKIPVAKPMTDEMKQEKADDKQAAMKLKKLTGNDFDAAFISQMVNGHERELARADSMVAQVQNSELSDMIRDNKTVLQQHADRAREIQRNLGTPTSSLSPSGRQGQARTGGTTMRGTSNSGMNNPGTSSGTKDDTSAGAKSDTSSGTTTSGTTQPKR